MESKKNHDINSDDNNTKTNYILIGLVLSLAIIYCGIEYYSADTPKEKIETANLNQEEEILEFDQSEPPPPPPPPPPPQAPPEEVEVLDEEDEREETQTQIIDLEADQIEVVDIPDEDEEPEVEQIFDVVEQRPSLPGCEGVENDPKTPNDEFEECVNLKIAEYLAKHTKYPEMAKENAIQGRVYIQFIVGKDGTIRDINVIKGVHKILDREALRVVKGMPKWSPGKQRGKAVSVRFTLPIKFKIN
jgi:protein TonB